MADKDSAQTPSVRNVSSQNSSSNQNDESKKMEENVPMELAATAPVAEERRGGFKRLFMKFGERVGIIKTTEFSKEYLDAVKNLDQYKELVADLCHAIMLVCQPNPELVPSSFSKMEFESPKDMDPFEKLANYLPSLDKHFADKDAQAAIREVCKNLGVAHRALRQRVRRSLHFMRTFLNVDCVTIDEERRILISCRQDMDFSRHEYTSNPTKARRLVFERSQHHFNGQTSKVFELLNQIPQKKIAHSQDLLNVLAEISIYHSTCYEECMKLRKYRAQLGPATPYDTL